MLRFKVYNRVSNLLCVTALTALALSGCSSERAQATHLERGENYLKNRQFAEAALEFRSVIELNRKLPAAHFGLARTFEGQERFAEAIEELRKTVELDNKNLEARVKLGNYLLLFQPQEAAEVEKLVNEIFAVDANYIDGHILQATLFAVQNRSTAEVLAVLERAIALDPNRVESYLSKARFFVSRQNLNEAEKTFQKTLEINSNSVVAHLDYGRFLELAKRKDEAEREFLRATELEPQNREAFITLAQFYVAHGKFDQAEAAYQKLASVDTNKLEGKTLLADFYASVGKDSEAIKVYQEILVERPEFISGHARLGELFLERNDIELANKQAQQILNRNARDVAGLLLKARVSLRGGDANAAIKDLQELLKQEPTNKLALYFMSDAQFRVGKIGQARSFIHDLKRFHPNYLYADQLEASINLAEGNLELARAKANEILSKLESAKRNGVSERDQRELKVGALTTRGLSHLQQNKLSEARADFSAAQTVSPNAAIVYLNLAKVAERANNLTEAQNLYAKALEFNSNDFDALNGLVNAKISQKQFAEAHATLDKKLNETAAGNIKAALLNLKSEVFNAENQFSEAETALKRAIEIDANYLPAYLSYAALLSSNNQPERAIETYRAALVRKPDDANVYTLIGLLEDARENTDAAVENYRKALQLDSTNAVAANNLGWLYAAHSKGNLDEAAALLQNLTEKYPSEAGYADTLGWIFYKKGMAELSLAQLRRAVKLDEQQAATTGRPTNPAYRMRLGAALAAIGDKASARREVEVALQNSKALTRSELEQATTLLASLN